MKKHQIFLMIVASALLSALLTQFFAPTNPNSVPKTETTYQRVMRTGKIRCGYFSWYPQIVKDPNTGELKGTFFDYMNALGKSLGLKIEWAEEIGLGEFPAALQSGRIDAFCSGAYVTGARARAVDFVTPAYYVPLYAFARQDDKRFDNNVRAVNDSKYTMAVLEGGVTSTIQQQLFPNVKPYELPQLTSPAELFTSLAQGKADAVIYDLSTYGDFNAHNPGKVKMISPDPIKVYPLVIGIKYDENNFREMLSSATLELQLSGEIDRIIKKHEVYPGSIYHPISPYQR